MKSSLPAIGAGVVTASYGIVFLPASTGHSLLVEDGPVEQATVIFFLAACLCLIRAWQLHPSIPGPASTATERRGFFLLLAFLMFACAGEEISWGQRIFGWTTPPGWSELNAQSETNLHNLVLIEGGVRDPATYDLLHSLTNANRLFALFSLLLFVFVPLLERHSPGGRRLLRTIGLPIPPLGIGGLFLLNHGLAHLGHHHLETLHLDLVRIFPLDELKEQNDALAYALCGALAWMRQRSLCGSLSQARSRP